MQVINFLRGSQRAPPELARLCDQSLDLEISTIIFKSSCWLAAMSINLEISAR
jgi:hypothetical protein